MHISLILLQMAGSVMLLIWAVRMVRTGVERAFGARLKGAMRDARGGNVRAAISGLVLAIVLQSSTAVGVLAAGFAVSGILSVSAGIAALLGADLGSALVVKILSFDLSWLIPLLLLVGAVLFLKFESGMFASRDGLLGVAFVLLSLRMIGEATEPLRHASALPQIVEYLQSDAVTAFILAAAFAWIVHSSIAAMLLLVTFADQGVLPLDVALPMVLGANVGGGIIAVWLTRGQELEARRIPMGNFLFRVLAAATGLAVLTFVGMTSNWLGASEGAQLVNFHVLFNMVLVVVCLPFAGAMAKIAERLIPERPTSADDHAILRRPACSLDRSVIAVPRLALASASRECLRMGETVETMLRPMMELLEGGNKEQLAALRRLDGEVNRLHSDIKLFIAEVNRGQLNNEEARRGIELTDFAINMEHVGDLVANTLLRLVDEMRSKGLAFSDDGRAEIGLLHERVLANFQLTLNVLISGDLDFARQLVRGKEHMRRLERDSHDRHLRRLQMGDPVSIETSDIHLDVVRALKEVNSLLATVGYPILESHGQLMASRLARTG